MSTLRFLFVVLLALNALAFVAIQGWLGTPAVRGEPERLANQLHPERIRLAGRESPDTPPPAATPDAAPAPATGAPAVASSADPAAAAATPPEAPPLCVAWTGLGADDAERLDAQLRAAGLAPQRSATESPSSWWVRMPPQGGRELAERKARELKALGITDYFIVQDAGPNQFAISLGLFKTEHAANQHLAQLRAKGVRSAGIASRNLTAYRIEVRAAAGALAPFTADGGPLPQRRAECAP